MELSQQIIDHVAISRDTPAADLIRQILDMCIEDRDSLCSSELADVTAWFPFDLDLAKMGARVQFRDGSTGSIEDIQDSYKSSYPITALRSVCESEMTYTTRGEHYDGSEDEFDIVMIEVGSEE